MSNTQNKTSGSFSLSNYKAKAKKIADVKGPFVLDVDTDKSITIPRPNANAILSLEQATTSRQVVEAICGEFADEILELFGPEDHSAFNAFGDDLREHFGVGQ